MILYRKGYKVCFQTKTQRLEPLRLIFCWPLLRVTARCQAPILRIRAFRRLFVRAALFLWIRPLLTMVSIFGTVTL